MDKEQTRPFHKGVYILPNLLTTAGLFLGFVGLMWAVAGRYEACALAVLAAALFDGLDGKVARLTKSNSDFGVQYDSLVDLIAFGVTPAVETAYRGSHARSTFHVLVQEIEVTPEQAEIAYRVALSSGPVPDAFCTSATATLLQQVPGLESINSVLYPVKLANQFEAIPGVNSSRYYENDSADLQEGLAANNVALNNVALNE